MGVSRWPYNCIRAGDFEMSRDEMADMGKSIIHRLGTGDPVIHTAILPFLCEAERLGAAFLLISGHTQTVCAWKLRARLGPRPSGSGSEALKQQKMPQSRKAAPVRERNGDKGGD